VLSGDSARAQRVDIMRTVPELAQDGVGIRSEHWRRPMNLHGVIA
jgi:hypothetical protein